MSRRTRAAVALALTLSFGAVPLIIDWCAARCERSTAAASAAPRCHDAGASTSRAGRQTSPCGQRHLPIVVDATAAFTWHSRAPIALLPPTDADALALLRTAALDLRAGTAVHRRQTTLALALSAALRI
jgi:hypothetical protein